MKRGLPSTEESQVPGARLAPVSIADPGRRNALKALAAAGVVSMMDVARGEEYPTRPIRFVVPFPAGGGTDIITRALAAKMSPSMGVPFVVENRGGAGGTIGTEAVVRSPADGYTILLGTPSALTVAPNLYKNLSYNPQRDLVPITLAGQVANILVVNSSLPVQSVEELIVHAKANPSKLNFSSAGNGTSGHLFGEMFNYQAGIKMTHVPYRGGAQATTSVLSGESQVSFGDMLSTLPHVNSGRLRALGVTSAKRSPTVPDVPAIAEAGLPEYDVVTWYGVLVVAKTPPEIVTRITTEALKALNQTDVRVAFAAQAVQVIASTPEEFADLLRTESAKYAKLIQDAKIQLG